MPPRRSRTRGRSPAKSKSNDQEKEDANDQIKKDSDSQRQDLMTSESQSEPKNDSQNTNINRSNSEPTSQIFESTRQKFLMTSRTSALRNSNSNSASSNANLYASNHRSSARTGNNSSRDSLLFQDRIIEILKNSRGQSLDVDEIINKAADFKNDDGIYQNLPLDKRVRCVLQVKKVLKEVVYDENTSKWSLSARSTDKQKNFFLPKELKGVKMKELSINELWNLLKEKNVY